MNSIGDRIRHIRGELSQAEFSDKTGINKSTLGRYERGINQPDAKSIEAICAAFNVRSEWLVSGRGPMEINIDENALIGLPIGSDDIQLIERVGGQAYNRDILEPIREALRETLNMKHIQISERHFIALSCLLYEEFTDRVAQLVSRSGSYLS